MTVAARERVEPRHINWTPLVIAAVVALLGLGAWAYFSTRPETVQVARRDIVVTLALDGKVVAPPNARADIMATYRAPVAKVYASVGDRVSQGDVLVDLSHPNAQVAYDQARQELQAARTALEQAQQQYSTSLNSARRQLDQARATERSARQSASAATTPAAGGTAAPAPAMTLQEATEARIAAEQAVLQAEAELESALTPYRQRLEAAQSAFAAAQSGRKVAQVKSPIYGTVLALNARPGQEIGGDEKTPVAVVVNLGDLQVHAPVDPSETAIRTGVPVRLTFEKVPGRQFEGEIERIVSQPSRPLQGAGHMAIIEFKNEEGLAKPDMDAHAAVIVSEAKNVVAVPSDAVDPDDAGRPTVQVLRDGRWQQVVVQAGLSDGRYTAIRSGLKEGETIKVTPDLL